MATIIVDDIDPNKRAEHRHFEWDGKQYHVDLSDEHYARLQAAIDTIVAHASVLSEFISVAQENYNADTNGEASGERSVRGQHVTKASTNGRSKKKKVVKRTVTSGPSAAEVRAWCHENGVEVSKTGIVQKSAYEAYVAAHQG